MLHRLLGAKFQLTDPEAGEKTEVELFVAVLGASNYTFAGATMSQRGPDFIASNVRMLGRRFAPTPAEVSMMADLAVHARRNTQSSLDVP